MDDTVIATLRGFLVTDLLIEIPSDRIGLDDGLQSVLGVDSVGFLELRVLCERHFGIRVSDQEFGPEHFATLRRLATLIEHHRAAQGIAS